MQLAETEAPELPEVILDVLTEFDAIFQDIGRLPSERVIDHAIVLKEGANIPNLRPSRYPHFQKKGDRKIGNGHDKSCDY